MRMIGSPLVIAPSAERAAALDAANARDRQFGIVDAVDGPEHVIVGQRQEGKTWLASRWLDETPRGHRRVLVTLNLNLARQINDAIFPYGDACCGTDGEQAGSLMQLEVTYVGIGGHTRAVTTDLDLGRGVVRAPEFGMRRAVWDAACGYVSGFRKRDIVYYILTRSLSRRVAAWALRAGR